jgi:hypothetical protein
MNPFTQRVASLLPNQYHKHALEVDSHLRVVGAPLGTVYALGDCATIETRMVDHLLEFVQHADEDRDGNIDRKEFEKMMMVRSFLPSPFTRDILTDFLRLNSTSSGSSPPRTSTSPRLSVF